MARIICAKYEKGVLKPLEKLDLEEGQRVRIIVVEEIGLENLFGILRTEACERGSRDDEKFYEYVSERVGVSR